MTFFANSGVAWPKLEQITQKAGQRSFEAASELWGVLASIEGSQADSKPDGGYTAERIYRLSNSLKEVARQYREVAEQTDDRYASSLSLAEFELAAILPSGRYERRLYDLPYYRYFDEDVSVRDLYRELATRLEILAAQLAALEPTSREKEDLAPQVFQIMLQWEQLAVLGRLIAVMNRRKSAVDHT